MVNTVKHIFIKKSRMNNLDNTDASKISEKINN